MPTTVDRNLWSTWTCTTRGLRAQRFGVPHTVRVPFQIPFPWSPPFGLFARER
jgi:hypothetical protein